MLIDVAIPNNNNLREKHNEKILKFRDLQEQVRRQWQMQWIETIPIVLSSTGVIPKSLLESNGILDLDTKIIRNMQKDSIGWILSAPSGSLWVTNVT